MQEPMPLVVQAGDKVLICLAGEKPAEVVDLMSSQLADHFEGFTVAVIEGVRAVVVQRAEAAE